MTDSRTFDDAVGRDGSCRCPGVCFGTFESSYLSDDWEFD